MYLLLFLVFGSNNAQRASQLLSEPLRELARCFRLSL
jgi:hypothetical protein